MNQGPRALRLVAGFVAAVALSACGEASPSSSPSSSAPSGPAGTASADPSAGVAPEPGELAVGVVAQVVADELRLRDDAGTDAALVGGLERGAAVRIEDGPLEADGFTWYAVVDLVGNRGWAAAGDGADPWLAPILDLSAEAPILTLRYACDVVGPLNPPATTVLGDGQVVSIDQSFGNPWTVRRLSDAGMQQVREEVLGSPYLQESAEFVPRLRADAQDPPGHGACSYTFTIRTGAEPIVVTSIGWFSDEEEAAFYEPSPERKALDALARNLIAIERVLMDDLWSGPALPYLAAEHALWIGTDPGSPAPEGAPTIEPDALGLGDLASFGSTAGSGRCAIVSREQAFEVARVLNEAGSVDEIRLDLAAFPAFITDDGHWNVVMVPQAPGEAACIDF